mgnify:CR=1 FL=1|tara:strand:+ start:4912 stop:5262 length:351 start_codon:yes stop_codon:yes gene_type:complete
MNLKQIQALSDKELNIKVAELLGWKSAMLNVGVHHEKVLCWRSPTSMWMTEGDGSYGMPNYCNDLNAMHDAEKAAFDWNTFGSYCGELDVVDENHGITATARQRAEAFVLTMKETT